MGIIHMNGRVYDPLIGRFMSADPYIQAPDMLQSYNRYAYVMNNPLNLTDPSGYWSLRSFFRSLVREVVVRTVLAIADVTFCAGYCTLAYNAYNGYKSGGVPGLIASFIPGSDNAWANAAINAGKGCVVAEANGGSCGQGATSSVVRGLGGDSLPGNMLAGCLSARINGGSCSGGASNAFISYAATHVADTAVGIYREAERMAAEETARQAYRGNLVACGPCVGILVYAPEILGAGRFLWSASRAYMAARGISRVLTMNEAANPEASNGTDKPSLPADIVGDQSDPRAGPNKDGRKWTSGALAPANGGTGDFDKDLDRLTGGTRPMQPGDKAPPGSLVGPNGIFGRPRNSSGGSSIDIPANGRKPHETLHYP
jgi:hypothetical protein